MTIAEFLAEAEMSICSAAKHGTLLRTLMLIVSMLCVAGWSRTGFVAKSSAALCAVGSAKK